MTSVSDLLAYIESNKYIHSKFLMAVEATFLCEPKLKTSPPVIHSIKSRVKTRESLEDKINRKLREGVELNEGNVFSQITDLAGMRLIHLHQSQFTAIHACIMEQVEGGDWVFFEQPKAYTWDPESREFFERHDLVVSVKESFYTSIHYVVKPRVDSLAACEIQVRTLFEEIWGEVDHLINYPHQTGVETCRDQIKVLARLVGSGSRLVDSIFKSHNASKMRVSMQDIA